MTKRLIIVVALATTLGSLPASAGESLSFTFEGAGWGHGVGFSQWGAHGQALEDPAKQGEDIAAYKVVLAMSRIMAKRLMRLDQED